jgi:GNAT superfamily N-acetyltransferase
LAAWGAWERASDGHERAVVEVRLANLDDALSLAGLRRAWVEEQHGGSVDDPGFDDDFLAWWGREQHRRVTWLAEDGNRSIGMLNLTIFERMPSPGRDAARWGYLANLYVRTDHRGQGVGARLLDACVGYADDEGFVRVVLNPSHLSVPLYLRAGFEPASSLLVRTGRPSSD